MTQGPEYLLRGLRMLREPGIRRYVAGPLIINIALFATLIGVAVQQFNFLLSYLDTLIPSWLDWLEYILWPLFALVMIVIVAFTFSMLVNIIGAPFNAILAEKVAQRTLGVDPASTNDGWAALLASVPRSIFRELARLAYTVPLALLLWILTLIPGLNIVAPLLWFLWGAWMMSIQYTDYPADNDKISFRDLRMQLSANRILTLGFGAGVTAATMVPLLNLVVMPAAVCGATLLWCERLKDQSAKA